MQEGPGARDQGIGTSEGPIARIAKRQAGKNRRKRNLTNRDVISIKERNTNPLNSHKPIVPKTPKDLKNLLPILPSHFTPTSQLRRLEQPGRHLDRRKLGDLRRPRRPAPSSRNFRAVTKTRDSSDATALL